MVAKRERVVHSLPERKESAPGLTEAHERGEKQFLTLSLFSFFFSSSQLENKPAHTHEHKFKAALFFFFILYIANRF